MQWAILLIHYKSQHLEMLLITFETDLFCQGDPEVLLSTTITIKTFNLTNLEPLPAIIGREAGYTVDRSPVYHRVQGISNIFIALFMCS